MNKKTIRKPLIFSTQENINEEIGKYNINKFILFKIIIIS